VRLLALTSIGLVSGATNPQAVHGQQTTGSVEISFRALSSNGDPVPDLRPDELRVRIDGRERTLESLEFVHLDAAPDALSEAEPAEAYATNETPAAIPTSRDVLFVVLAGSIPARSAELVRTGIGEILDGLTARDRVGLMTGRAGEDASATLSNDHGRVRAGLESMLLATGSPCPTGPLANLLTGVLEARSGATPLTVVAFLAVGDGAAGVCGLVRRTGEYLEAAAAASAAQVYLIQVPARNGDLPVFSGVQDVAAAANAELQRVVGSTRDVTSRILRETSGFYRASVAVAADTSVREHTRREQRLGVEVSRPGVRVLARTDVRLPSATSTSDTAGPSRTALLHAARPSTGIPLRATAFAAPDERPALSRIVVFFESTDPAVQLSDAAVAIFGEDGELAGQWSARPGDLDRRTAVAALVGPPQRYRIRVAAIDRQQRAGAVDYFLPAMASLGTVRLSSLVLGTLADRNFTPRFEFDEEDAAVYFEVHDSAPDTILTAMAEVATAAHAQALLTLPMAVPEPNARGVRVVIAQLPLTTPAHGDYVVRVHVSIGDARATGMRAVRKVAR